MVISHNSQLGLRFRDNPVKMAMLQSLRGYLEGRRDENLKIIEEYKKEEAELERKITIAKTGTESEVAQAMEEHKNKEPLHLNNNHSEVREKVNKLFTSEKGVWEPLLPDTDSSYYFICSSVYKAAELVRIKENFTGRTIKDIGVGKYTYLMGKNRMVRFICVVGAIMGFYYDEKNNVVFDWGIDMDSGEYFFDEVFSKEFTSMMQILTFVELGDIEVKMLEGGRNNGAKDKENKIANTSNKTVYVVDSSWNQIIIRTDGFAVRGHFKLQPCGPCSRDRKLIWIDAFEKHGYTRKPKAEIVR